MSDFKNNCSVIGAGVIGLMTAWMLNRRGWRVTVYDQARAFSGSSWAGGGLISPVPPWGYPVPVRRLVSHSLQLYPSLLQELHQISGVDAEYIHDGLLYFGPFDEASEPWRSEHADQVEVGRLSDWLDGAPDTPAWYFRNVAQVRNPRLGQALLQACCDRGIEIIEHAPVQRLNLKGGEVAGLELASGEQHAAGQVVLAAGAWSDLILNNTGLPGLGVKPLRGQMLLWKGAPGLLPHVVTGNGRYLIPRKDGHILGGSTVEDVGFDTGCTDDAQDRIQAACHAMFPPLAELPLIQRWSGLRPAIDREVPVIGAFPQITGLWINTGHFRNGLGMAPASAQLLSDLMNGRQPALDAQPFRMPETARQTRPAA